MRPVFPQQLPGPAQVADVPGADPQQPVSLAPGSLSFERPEKGAVAERILPTSDDSQCGQVGLSVVL